MNFVINHAPSAGSIARPVNQQSSASLLYYGRPLLIGWEEEEKFRCICVCVWGGVSNVHKFQYIHVKSNMYTCILKLIEICNDKSYFLSSYINSSLNNVMLQCLIISIVINSQDPINFKLLQLGYINHYHHRNGITPLAWLHKSHLHFDYNVGHVLNKRHFTRNDKSLLHLIKSMIPIIYVFVLHISYLQLINSGFQF